MNKDNNLKWIIIGFLVMILFTSYNGGIQDKKTSVGEWGSVGFGLVGLAAGTVMILFLPVSAPVGLWIIGGSLALIGGGGLFKGIAGLLTPDASIPGWIWIVAGIVLFVMLMRSKK